MNSYHSQAGFNLIELMIVIAIIGILSTIAISQYQVYVGKSQVLRIIAETSNVKNSIEYCLMENKKQIGTGVGQCNPAISASPFITGASQVGTTLPSGTGVAQITNPLTINTHITAEISNKVIPKIKTKKVSWQRNNNGVWQCMSNIAPEYLPLTCIYDSSL